MNAHFGDTVALFCFIHFPGPLLWLLCRSQPTYCGRDFCTFLAHTCIWDMCAHRGYNTWVKSDSLLGLWWCAFVSNKVLSRSFRLGKKKKRKIKNIFLFWFEETMIFFLLSRCRLLICNVSLPPANHVYRMFPKLNYSRGIYTCLYPNST